jgi:hypothetical protein
MADLAFDCTGVRADRYAVVPSMSLTLRISETSGQLIDAIALRCQIRIEPTRRRYSAAEEERLNDLFGEPQRWSDTLKPMQFTTVSAMVPGFRGSTEIDLPITFSYDLEIASARYFASLESGEIPLLLLFSGTVFATVDGRLQVQQVPWSKEAVCRVPVGVWREAIDAHFPNSAWIRMSRQTLQELERFKSRRALPTWDATVLALLAKAAPDAEEPRPPGGTGAQSGAAAPGDGVPVPGAETPDGTRAPEGTKAPGGTRAPDDGVPVSGTETPDGGEQRS